MVSPREGMSLYFDRQGRPITMEQWVAGMGTDRHVGLTDLGPLGQVSTVWLGLNHGWGAGPPLIFETMVFGGPLDEYQERYATEEEASTGHDFIVMAILMLRDDVPRRPALIHNGRKPRK
jgi:hypothetical protein